MTSERKARASRANGAKSKGPKTAAGKAVSRNNAFKHGMRSRAVVIPGEDQAEYDRLHDGYAREFEPMTLHEEFLVKRMVDARWRLARLDGIETALYDEPEIDVAELDRISRWQVRLDNSYNKAAKQLQAGRKELRLPEIKESNKRMEKIDKNPQPRKVVLYWENPETGEVKLAPGFTQKDVEEANDDYRRVYGKEPPPMPSSYDPKTQ